MGCQIFRARGHLTGRSRCLVTVSNSAANQVRSILGLNLRGSTVTADADVWLHEMSLESALMLGMNQYNGRGCQNPKMLIK